MAYECIKPCFVKRRYRVGDITNNAEVAQAAPRCFKDTDKKAVEVERKGVAISELKGRNIEAVISEKEIEAAKEEESEIKRAFGGKWKLPNGDIVGGSRADAEAAWEKIK